MKTKQIDAMLVQVARMMFEWGGLGAGDGEPPPVDFDGFCFLMDLRKLNAQVYLSLSRSRSLSLCRSRFLSLALYVCPSIPPFLPLSIYIDRSIGGRR